MGDFIDILYEGFCDMYEAIGEFVVEEAKSIVESPTSALEFVGAVAGAAASIYGFVTFAKSNSPDVIINELEEAKEKESEELAKMTWQAEETAITVISLLNNEDALKECVRRHLCANAGISPEELDKENEESVDIRA